MKHQDIMLGVDVSTRKIGVSILDLNEQLLYYSVINLPTDQPYERRAEYFFQILNNIPQLKNVGVSYIFVEEPFISVSIGQAQSTAKLHRFNGMICYGLYNQFNLIPILVNVNRARSVMEIKYKKGMTKKERKQKVIDYVDNRYSNFSYTKTKKGNFKPGTDDQCDAIITALAGMKLLKENNAN